MRLIDRLVRHQQSIVIALCSDIGPLLLVSLGGGRVGHSEAYGAMLKRTHRRDGPISLTTALVRGGAREEVEHHDSGDDQRYPDDAREVERFAPEQHPGEDGAGGAEPGPDGVGGAERY